MSVIRPKKHSLHPSDLQLVFNMLFEAEGVHAGGGDAWIPICLPGFNNSGYLYMYVSFLDMRPQTHDPNAIREMFENPALSDNTVNQRHTLRKEDVVAIILLSTNKESFESLRSMKTYMVHDLHRNGGMRAIQQAIAAGRPRISDILNSSSKQASTPTKSSLHIPSTSSNHPIQHFLYKSKPHVQFLQPTYPPLSPSTSYQATLHRTLLSIYATLHSSLHPHPTSRSTLSKPQIHHHTSPTHSALAWSTQQFELYCIAGPNISRSALAAAATRVVQWVQREEERVFIIGGAVF